MFKITTNYCVHSLLVVILLVNFGKCSDNLTAKTSDGPVLGLFGGKTVRGKNDYYVYNIPYAEPPVGNLRFQPPVKKIQWFPETFDATTDAPPCVQGSNPVLGVEDCLYVKVVVPGLPSPGKNLPVLVWIHGGGFVLGSANFTETGPDFFLDEGFLVVGVQYRLGVFGFLSTNDLTVPGNNGLKDLILALNWVKENIENFGGDPGNVTLMGQSAGSACVSYLLQTDKTKGLFQRAILESGVSLSLWSLTRDGKDMAETIANDLEIRALNSRELLQELQAVDHIELQNAFNSVTITRILSSNPRDGMVFGPVIEPEHDGAVISGKSHELLSRGRFHDVPILIGYNSLEDLINIQGVLALYLLKYDVLPLMLIPIDMNVEGLFNIIEAATRIKEEYFNNGLVTFSNSAIKKFISDDQFERPVQEFARLFSKKSSVYFYIFSYEGVLSGIKNRTGPGVGHAEELSYLFNTKNIGTPKDYLIRKRMVKMWSNFAKTGNPTSEKDALLENIIWPALDKNDPEENLLYLDIGENLTVGKNPNKNKMVFWRKLYKKYGKPPYDTY